MNAVEIVQDKGPCGPQANACFKTAGSAEMMDSRFEAVMSHTEYAELFADINRRIEREVISSWPVIIIGQGRIKMGCGISTS